MPGFPPPPPPDMGAPMGGPLPMGPPEMAGNLGPGAPPGPGGPASMEAGALPPEIADKLAVIVSFLARFPPPVLAMIFKAAISAQAGGMDEMGPAGPEMAGPPMRAEAAGAMLGAEGPGPMGMGGPPPMGGGPPMGVV